MWFLQKYFRTQKVITLQFWVVGNVIIIFDLEMIKIQEYYRLMFVSLINLLFGLALIFQI
jgi:hypothetical protein